MTSTTKNNTIEMSFLTIQETIMRLLILIFFIFSLQYSYSNTSTPRETFQTFLKAMVKVKMDQGSQKENYLKAISTFHINSETSLQYDEGVVYANQLIKVIDKIKKVRYSKIPSRLKARVWFFDKRNLAGSQLEISLVKRGDHWFFGPSTFASLEGYLENLKDKNYIEGVMPLQSLSDKIRQHVPSSLTNKVIFFEHWQWIGICLLFIIALIAEKIATFLITFALQHSSKIVTLADTEKLSEAINPLGKIIFIFSVLQLSHLLDFGPKITALISQGLSIAISFMTVWFAHKVIQYISDYFSRRAAQTLTKFDDILIPLLTKTAFVIIYILGALLVASSLNIDVTGIVAGLGIGGLAFAFAAKDTLANFFGSIMLVLDRPFDIGDIITAGDIEGIVTEVGFRSTRIRTFNDSLITISNGELMNRSIDNKGKRRFRRLVTNLGLEYDTAPVKIEAFCEGIRQLILSHKWTRKDNFHVYFTNFGPSSLDIQVVVYWKTEDYSRELSEKHRLMIDILRLADELGVSFAFPTQTLHMFNETKPEQKDFEPEYLQAGIQKAKRLVQKPLSLKNPRSNGEDKNQFGDNDIGID